MADRIYDYKREKTKRVVKKVGFVISILVILAIVFQLLLIYF